MRKILVIILFAVAGAFADALYSVGAGYSSLGRIETSAFEIRIGNGGHLGVNLLRFDIRTGYNEGEYDSQPVSLGAPIVTVPAMLIGILENTREDIALLMISLAFLASGELGYQFLDYKPFKLSVFESHVFEWWLYKKNDKWHMDEAGWGQELGLELQFPHVLLSGGAQFEITNKRKGIGWFARINLIDIFYILYR
ncbi:MAG: hypothetical protein MJY93_03710 [Fibrobacter sp.]|nr:hypothetical protein [Fibrobacter sp.]